ncbi:MAG: UbiX family flavin prenyltransferase [Methanobrevibacter sp.]|jgi:4-hydroxy-3-polyprenylbenzoate decarboxylase|nr:UbiX family flavin prenyltransferase [Candidatus Methanovirga aequatorialis]
MIIIAITGASGVSYGFRLLEVLKEIGIGNGLLISKSAETIIEYELDEKLEDVKKLADVYYEYDDLTSSINSGSFKFDSLIIVPCSMKTLSAIANGYGNNSITRAADVTLKEKRLLIVVPRETPLRNVHIRNMLKISEEGGIILPAMPGFYNDPTDVNDMIDFIVGKILNILKIDNEQLKPWDNRKIKPKLLR